MSVLSELVRGGFRYRSDSRVAILVPSIFSTNFYKCDVSGIVQSGICREPAEYKRLEEQENAFTYFTKGFTKKIRLFKYTSKKFVSRKVFAEFLCCFDIFGSKAAFAPLIPAQ